MAKPRIKRKKIEDGDESDSDWIDTDKLKETKNRNKSK